ncbi:hypothetical protein WN51_06686 [Melipona quadrifasciata]|uniref:Uncharacterized protein n=1 Tax=Melipona quadrifasciata TaxID=166423 RepID=A0A0M9AA90_9HYME|nr:hypothetical protein WN51_06686 [Melipona quadrifasciata]
MDSGLEDAKARFEMFKKWRFIGEKCPIRLCERSNPRTRAPDKHNVNSPALCACVLYTRQKFFGNSNPSIPWLATAHIEQFSSGSELLLPGIVLLPITRGQYISVALKTLGLYLKMSKIKRPCLQAVLLLQRPRIPQIRVSNTRLAQAASGCAPSVDVLPIFDVKQQSVRNPARMGANQPSRFSYNNKRLGDTHVMMEVELKVNGSCEGCCCGRTNGKIFGKEWEWVKRSHKSYHLFYLPCPAFDTLSSASF